jgi:periplasmic copper chaperone A
MQKTSAFERNVHTQPRAWPFLQAGDSGQTGCMTRKSSLSRCLAAGALVAAAMSPGSAVQAHAKPNKASVPAGTRTTVQFTIQHGCDTSPTVKVAVKLPAGLTKVTAVSPKGWKGALSTKGDTITWTGGPLDATKQAQFGMTATFPKTKGVTLRFPMVQTCTKGVLRWIEGATSDYPTPTVKLT